mgnify:CR=1 FL=1
MKYTGTLIAVSDINRSKQFYQDVLGLKVLEDFGANVMLEGGVFLQTIETWKEFIKKERVDSPDQESELYFEERNMDKFLKHLKSFDISYVHEPLVHSWGQRAVRFYDPDKHIIEVAEEIAMVVRRFIDDGYSLEETAVRMDVPFEYVIKCLEASDPFV